MDHPLVQSVHSPVWQVKVKQGIKIHTEPFQSYGLTAQQWLSSSDPHSLEVQFQRRGFGNICFSFHILQISSYMEEETLDKNKPRWYMHFYHRKIFLYLSRSCMKYFL